MPSTNEQHDGDAAGTKDAPLASPRRHSRRMLLMLVLPAVICIIGVALLLQMLVGQKLPQLTEDELAKAEELWTSAGPASYEMDLDILQGQPGKVHIEVQNGEITAMTRDNRTPAQRTWSYLSVPGLFEMLERELEMAEDPVHEVGADAGTRWQLRCEFDPGYGYPRRFHRYVSGGGPEVYWRVTSFIPK
ncbi:MAG TPA: DUF6174 domain-containing protein [Lacipirellulaceae bacterium]|nr:DUF6174 domain-containing protein [Lacipirellulaceae bacterium]